MCHLMLDARARSLAGACLLALVGYVGPALAAPVTQEVARRVAANWVVANEPLTRGIRGVPTVADSAPIRAPGGAAVAYLVNLKPEGYVIVPADDSVTPILVHGPRGRLDPIRDAQHPLLDVVRADVPSRIAAARRQRAVSSAAQARWNRLRVDPARVMRSYSQVVVEGFVKEEWYQSDLKTEDGRSIIYESYYNKVCPPFGSTKPYSAGCIATAMAMVIHHFRHPASVSGQQGYVNVYDSASNRYPLYGFSMNAAYDYEQMPLMPQSQSPMPSRSILDQQANAISLLQWHCGVASWLTYDSEGTGLGQNSLSSRAYYIERAMRDVFNYPGTSSSTNWSLSRCKTEVEASRPVLLLISGRRVSDGEGAGHCVVCDGWRKTDIGDQLHINFGWGHDTLHYYTVPDFVNATFTKYRWDTVQASVYNIAPPARVLPNIPPPPPPSIVVPTAPTDTSLPLLAIDAPMANETVSGNKGMAGWALDRESGMQSVSLFVDGRQLTNVSYPVGRSDGNPGFACTWASSSVGNGRHVLLARATNRVGLTKDVSRTFYVSNAAADTSPPDGWLDSPLEGQRIRGVWRVVGWAADPQSGVSSIQLLDNGYDIGGVTAMAREDGNPGFYKDWDTASAAPGTHTLVLRLTNGAGLRRDLPVGIRIVPNFLLLKADNEATIYRVDGCGVRRAFPSTDCVADWQLTNDELQTVPRQAIDQYRYDDPIPHLIRGPDLTIYYIESGQRRPIPNMSTFEAMGFRTSDFVEVSQARVEHYPRSPETDFEFCEPRLIVAEGPTLPPPEGVYRNGLGSAYFTLRDVAGGVGAIAFETEMRIVQPDGTVVSWPGVSCRERGAGDTYHQSASLTMTKPGRHTVSLWFRRQAPGSPWHPCQMSGQWPESVAALGYDVLPADPVSSLTIDPTDPLRPGDEAEITVHLGGSSWSGPTTVRLASDNPAVVSVPPTLEVLEGQDSATLPITAGSVSHAAPVHIQATSGGLTRELVITVVPLTITDLAASPITAVAGTSMQGTIKVDAKGGAIIEMTSSDPSVLSVPDVVTIPPGSQSALFVIRTHATSTPRSVVISAELGESVTHAAVAVMPLYEVPLTPGLHCLGAPMTPYDPSPESVVRAASWQLSRFNPLTQLFEQFATGAASAFGFKPGAGLWLTVGPSAQMRFIGEPVRGNSFTAPLAAGWNNLGNPYNADLPWDADAIHVLAGATDLGPLSDPAVQQSVWPYTWVFDSPKRRYQLVSPRPMAGATQTVPWLAGFWVYAHRDGLTLRLAPPTGTVNRVATRSVGPRDWQVELLAKAGDQAAVVQVGVASDITRATVLTAPPSPIATGPLTMAVLRDGRRAVGAIDPGTGSRWQWDLVVTGPAGQDVTLTWPALLRSLPRGVVLTLGDPTTGRTTVLNNRSAYTVQAGSVERRLTLTARLANQERPQIVDLRPSITRGGSRFDITLSQPAALTLTVKGIGGTAVRQLVVQGRAASQAIAWDGLDTAGRPLPHGMYQVELVAVGEDGASSRTVRTVVMR